MTKELSREMVLISIVAVIAVVGIVGITKIGTTPMEFIAEEMSVSDNLITGDAIDDCMFYIDSAIAFEQLANEAESEEVSAMYYSLGIEYAESAVNACN